MSKPDRSPRVPNQNKKLGEKIQITPFPWTPKQQSFIDLAMAKDTKIMLVKGPAGTTKTNLSVFCSLLLLNEKAIDSIIYVRSAVESSESHVGFLPGNIDEKMAIYNLPYLDKIDEFVTPSAAKMLVDKKYIQSFPINYARGMTWHVKSLIFDEVQNSSAKEIITLMTRLGVKTKCFILADPDQTDLPNSKAGGFDKIYNAFNDEESFAAGIRTFEFGEEDILRSELVKFIVGKTKKIK